MEDYVILENSDWGNADGHGTEMGEHAKKAGRQDQHGVEPRRGPALTKLGTRGEIAVAKYLRVAWPANMDTYGEYVGDVRIKNNHGEELKVEVRTADTDPPRLTIRGGDHKGAFYVLVCEKGVSEGVVHHYILGYMNSLDAMLNFDQETPGNRVPCWRIPANKLKPMSGLLDEHVWGPEKIKEYMEKLEQKMAAGLCAWEKAQ